MRPIVASFTDHLKLLHIQQLVARAFPAAGSLPPPDGSTARRATTLDSESERRAIKPTFEYILDQTARCAFDIGALALPLDQPPCPVLLVPTTAAIYRREI